MGSGWYREIDDGERVEELPEGEYPDWSTKWKHVTTIEGGRVSSVFLALDHSFSGGRPCVPVLYETMVFDIAEADQWCRRYETRAECLAEHPFIVFFAEKFACAHEHEEQARELFALVKP
tara:strand:+ start:457 stop:816 length:360 start_codon:yes stop_codon:yes gene_type:complete